MPLFSRPYRNLEQEEPVRKAELLREIAARTTVRESVVELVLETFKEVATEEMVNKGEFNFAGLFRVRSYQTKEANTGIAVIPPQKRLSIRLGERVKRIWKAKIKAGIEEPENFDEMRENYLSGDEARSIRNEIGLLNSEQPSSSDDRFYNPMLDDDDDY